MVSLCAGCRLLLAVTLLALAAPHADAVDYWYWDGTDTDNTTSPGVGQGGAGTWNLTNTNWYVGPGYAYDANGDPVVNVNWENLPDRNVAVFDGVGGLVTVDGGGVTNDRHRRHADGLLFNVGGYTFTRLGAVNDRITVYGDNAIVLTAGVTSNVTFTNVSIALGSDSTFTNSGTGTLVLGGGVVNQITAFPATLTIDGSGDTTFDTAAIGTAGGGVIKNGSGTLSYNFANTYTGTTTVNAGTLRYGVINAISSGPVTINNGGTLDIVSFTDTVGLVTLNHGGTIMGTTGVLTTSATGFVSTGGSISGFTTGGLTLGGNVAYNTDAGNETTLTIDGVLGSAGRTYTIADGVQAVDVDIIGVWGNGNSSIIKAGAGTLQTSGTASNNMGTGTTSVQDGVLLLNKTGAAVNALGSGAITIGDNVGAAGSAVLRYATGSNNDQIQNSAITVNSDGLFDLNNHNETTSGTLTVNSGGQVTTGTGNLATGALTVNSGGSLIGAGGSVAVTGATIVNGTLNTGGGDLSGTTTLTMTGGSIDTGAGTFTLGGNVTGNASATTATIAGNLDLGAATRTFTIADGAAATDMEVSAVISGAVGLTKAGAGHLVLSGDNSYSGVTTINGGKLTLSGDNSGASGGVTLNNTAAILNINSATALGTGALTFTLAGTIDNTSGSAVTLTTANAIASNATLTFTGTNDLNMGTGAVTLSTARTFNINASTLTFGGTVTGTNTNITKNGAGTLVINSLSTGTGQVTHTAGTLTLSGSNSYSGVTTISGNATLNLTGSNASNSALTFNTSAGTFNRTDPGSGTNQNMGTLTFTGGNATVQSTYGGAGNVSLTFSSMAARGTAGGTGNFIVSGGTNGSTNKIVLTGQTLNSFIGTSGLFFNGANYTWYDSGGYVRAINYGSDAGAVTNIGGTTAATTAHLQITGNLTAQNTATFTTLKIAGANNITLASGQTVTVTGILKTGGGSATISGGTGLQIPSAIERVIRTDSSTDSLTIDSALLATGTNRFIKTGAGTLTLTNSGNAFTGAAFINEGTLVATANNALGTAAAGTTVYIGGTLKLDNVNYSTSEGLTLYGAGASGQNGALVSTGTSTYAGLVILGSAATISVDSGTLNLSNIGTTTGATFALTLTGAGDGAYAGIIGNTTGGVIKSGAGQWTLSGANTYTGTTTVNAGTLTAGSATAFGPAANASLIFGAGSTGKIQLNGNSMTVIGLNTNATTVGTPIVESGSGIAGTDTLTVNNAAASTYAGVLRDGSTRSLALTKSAAGALVLSGDNTYSGLTNVTAGALTLSGNNAAMSGGVTLTAGTLNVNHAGALGTGTFTYASGTLDNTSGGAVVLSTNPAQAWNADIAFTGGASLNLGTGAVTLGANRLVTTTANTLAVGGIGDGGNAYTLTKAGAGTLEMNGANTYTGLTTVNAGVLTLAGNNSAMSGGVTVNAGTLNVNHANALGTGTLTVAGGTIDNTSGGAIAVSTNPAQAWNANFAYTGSNDLNLGTGAVTISATRTVTANAGTLTVGGAIGDGGGGFGLTKAGNGTMVLSGNNTYTGTTTVSAGTLALGASNRIDDTSGLTVSGMGTFDMGAFSETVGAVSLTGTSGGISGTGTLTATSYSVAPGAGGALTITTNLAGVGATFTKTVGNSSVTLSGDNSAMSGGVTFSAGTLALGSATALGTGAFVFTPAGGTITNVSGAPLTLTTPNAFSWTGVTGTTLTLAGNHDLNMGTGTWTMAGLGQAGFSVSSGLTLTIGGAITDISSGHQFFKTGAGRLVLTGASTFTDTTFVLEGNLQVDGSLASIVSVAYGISQGKAVVSGTGKVVAIINDSITSPGYPGSGLVSPGNSPGILTAGYVRPASGLDFAFEFTTPGSPNYGSPANSGNDVLRLTDPTAPIEDSTVAGTPGFMVANNDIYVYFQLGALSNGDIFRGGFYTDNGDHYANISGATYWYYVLGDGNGSYSFNGYNYYLLSQLHPTAYVTVTTVQETADFGTGAINGYVTQFGITMTETVIPEPGTAALLLAAGLLPRRPRR